MATKLNFSLEKQYEIAQYATNHTLQETVETFGISKDSVVKYKRKNGLAKLRPKYLPLSQRLENHITSKDNCWLTDLPNNGHGYCKISVNGKTKYAHRIAYEVYKGKIPENMQVCHSCDIPGCINPSHLFIGTQQENLIDCINKGRSNKPKGENHHKAKLNESNVRQIKSLLVESNLTLKQIAEIFDVGIGAISDIKKNKTWKHITI
ncbi:HNH endonuclease signature motif containing protein [Microcoleus sp. A006_D1]|uniref:HNH endonuclease signature motif containing protein n=1 Tax=Microcoleus sp. A006_D1 TaxID=3055267 RepID=UPI002FD0EF84